MLRVFGLKNCDTCRKARKWLDAENIAHEFRDLRADGITEDDVRAWLDSVGLDTLLNRRGTTWRKLDDADKEIADDEAAIILMHANPTLMKRPIFVDKDQVMVGFGEPTKAMILNKT